mmetsp:Transcript_104097/g.247735  ORF Transcript_104097/g.247735 Transcript_104097/m.247735 type:complete len:529 (+) Transcript_104097:80-1666(+)
MECPLSRPGCLGQSPIKTHLEFGVSLGRPLGLPTFYTEAGVFPGAFACVVEVARVCTVGPLVDQGQLRDPLPQGVVCVGLRDHLTDLLEALGNREGGVPRLPQNVQAQLAVRAHVAMVDGGLEGDVGGPEGVVAGDEHVQGKNAAFEGGTGRTFHECAPEADVLRGKDVNARGHLGALLQLLQHPLDGARAQVALAALVYFRHGDHLGLGQVLLLRVLHPRHVAALGNVALLDGLEVLLPPPHEGRLLLAAAARCQGHHRLRLQELEALPQMADLVALPLRGAHDAAQVRIRVVPHQNRVHRRADVVHGLQRLLRRRTRVVLPVSEYQHTQIRTAGAATFEIGLQHLGRRQDGGVDGRLPPLRHVVHDALEAIQRRRGVQKLLHLIVELQKPQVVLSGAHGLHAVPEGVEHGLHRLHARALRHAVPGLPSDHIQRHLREGRPHGPRAVDADGDDLLHRVDLCRNLCRRRRHWRLGFAGGHHCPAVGLARCTGPGFRHGLAKLLRGDQLQLQRLDHLLCHSRVDQLEVV